MKSLDVVKLYSKRTRLYQWFFIHGMFYERGIKKFFRIHPYLYNKARTILDAGCGDGLLIRSLHELAPNAKRQFFAFDLTQAMLDVFRAWAQNQRGLNLSLEKANVIDEEWMIRDNWGEFELVMSSAMLEYVSKADVVKALNNLKRVKSKTGVFLIFITRKNFLMQLLIGKWWKANTFDKQELLELLAEAGFKDPKFHQFPFPFCHLNLWGFIIEAT